MIMYQIWHALTLPERYSRLVKLTDCTNQYIATSLYVTQGEIARFILASPEGVYESGISPPFPLSGEIHISTKAGKPVRVIKFTTNSVLACN